MQKADCPELLFRCYSRTSAGRLTSRRYQESSSGSEQALERNVLREDFKNHADIYSREKTALVSTTSNLLRAVHIAFRKQWDEEDVRKIKIVLINPSSQPTKLHHGMVLAKDIGLSQGGCDASASEYLFEWYIPRKCVVRRVTLATLTSRGFDMQHLVGEKVPYDFPNLSGFLHLIKEHWRRVPDSQQPWTNEPGSYRGYLCGILACCFGSTGFRETIALTIFGWTIKKGSRYSSKARDIGIDWALSTHDDIVLTSLVNREDDFDGISRELAEVDLSYRDALDEIYFACAGEPGP